MTDRVSSAWISPFPPRREIPLLATDHSNRQALRTGERDDLQREKTTMIATTQKMKLPKLVTPLPGPNAKKAVARDVQFVSPSYTRDYPLVVKRGRGALVEDVDGNVFLDFAAGIAVCSTGHCHPQVVEAIQKQAAELIHMSGTDFYYESMPILAERLAATVPGSEAKKVFF